MPEETTTSILFVCTGNICRSPTAEGVMRHMVAQAGLSAHIAVDSAGTHDYFIDEPPDFRAQAAARRRGYALGALRARQVAQADFERFDLILAMDGENLTHLQGICPPEHQHKIGMLMEYARHSHCSIVPDPYSRGFTAFERVLDYVEDACAGLLAELRAGRTHHAAESASSTAARL
ncbi:protein tyrosine phosphatase [Noviherbaspirillum humi]|uniref:protein-tyrosine-phosphatase n=1 Tax=Noviherbaspirillum humi TaxID=1688639 RepID=A0A239DDJ2_9BURK|nr:low molecular weight protein-tyrosine-phosphatase [Noviherbaspirillum humi]SNS29981.1 protein tyrosine phosphatase [Noviherbaspirillum humi]